MEDVNLETKTKSPTNKLLVAYIVWMVILTVVYFWLIQTHKNTALPFAWLAIGVSGITAIVTGIVRFRPSAWVGWALLAGANAFFISGDTNYKVLHYLYGRTNPFPSYSDALYLTTYVLLALGLIVFIRRRSSAKSDRGAILDAATFTVGLTLVVSVYLIIPNSATADTPLLARITSIAYPLGDVLVWAMLVRLLVIDAKTRAVQILALGAFGLIIADIIYGLGQFYGFWHEGSPVDLGWILFYASWGAAALHPSMKLLDKPIVRMPPIRLRRLILLAATALIAPALLFVEARRGHAAQVAGVVAVFSAVLFVLVILRMFTLLREISQRDAEIALEKQKNEIIEIVSHQLRTPLTVIQLYSEFMLKDEQEISRQKLVVINGANQRLIELVNTLLFSTQLDMGTTQFKSVPEDLGAVVRRAIDDNQALLDEKGAKVALNVAADMPASLTDREALRTAISCVINNAARYGQPDGAVISIDIKHDSGIGSITVQDAGIGITDQDQLLIFTKLFRGINAVTSFPDGVGLGLYMAKSVVERLGGNMGFTSQLAKGSSFHINLPVESQPLPATEPLGTAAS